MREIVLIDFSSIAVPIWKMSGSEPDPNAASTKMVERVRALATGKPCAVCMDSGKSFRHDLDPSYKANRPERDEPMHHQIRLAEERLAGDGFPIWKVAGFEADDVIASAVSRALLEPDTSVLVVSSDKDLLALVGPRVRAMSASNGTIYDEAGVGAKFGITPAQIRDYLTLVGDPSDNIKGCKSIGGKKAAALLSEHGSLDAVYEKLTAVGGAKLGLPSSVSAALREFQASMPMTRKLVTLRTDADVPFQEILVERVPKEAATFGMEEEVEEDHEPAPAQDVPSVKCDGNHALPRCADRECWQDDRDPKDRQDAAPVTPGQQMVVHQASEILPAPAEWERGLDPRSMKDARMLAKDLYDSRMFSAYGTPQAVLSTIMVGRELGLPAMASLRCVWNIEGKHSLSASLMAALVIKSGLAEYFEPISFSDTEATYETKRKGGRNPIRLTHTFEMGKQAWPKTKPDWEKSFLASGWGRNPTDMLVARCQARLARLVYPDLLAGLYTPEELEEMRQAVAA